MKAAIRLVAIGACLLPLAATAAPPPPRGQDPNWPCQQPLVPQLSASLLWSGPPVEDAGDWHSDPAVSALVERISPRSVSSADGQAAIGEFLKGLSGDKSRPITLAFAGLLETTNRQRGEVIDRLKSLAERQRNLSDTVAKLTAEVDATPGLATVTGEQVNEKNELLQRWTFATRAYNELQQTMRYACEVPGQIDGRLGAYARALQAGLS